MQSLIFQKMFPSISSQDLCRLKSPTGELLEIVRNAINVFKSSFPKIWHRRNIKKNLLKELMFPEVHRKRSVVEGCVLNENFVLDLLFRVLIQRHCKWSVTDVPCHEKSFRKLKIIDQ